MHKETLTEARALLAKARHDRDEARASLAAAEKERDEGTEALDTLGTMFNGIKARLADAEKALEEIERKIIAERHPAQGPGDIARVATAALARIRGEDA